MALFLNVAEFVQTAVVVLPHSARVEVDHMLELMQLILNLDNLVDLFLVGANHKARLTVAQSKGHLFSRRVLIKRHRHSTSHLSGNHRPIKVRAVATDNGDMIARIYAHVDQA